MMYRLFDLNIQIDAGYRQTEQTLEKYRSETDAVPDIVIRITDSEIAEERAVDAVNSEAYLEMICIFRHITEEILDFDGLFVHSAVLDVNGAGYMLTGRSGAGKSTLAMSWTKYIKNAEVINGDKPILRFFPDGIYAYGSPWCGTEGLNVNGRVKLVSCGFVVHSEKNFAVPVRGDEVFKRLLNQTVIPKNAKRRLKHFELLDTLIKEIPFCEINCDISRDAAEMSYSAMTNIQKTIFVIKHEQGTDC